MYVYHKVKARSCKYCCRGKAMSITQTINQHAICMRHIVICGLPHSTTFSTLCHKRHDFWTKKKLQNIKVVFWISLQLLSHIFFIYEEMSEILSKMYIGLHVKYFLVQFQWNLNFLDISSKKYSKIKFHENPSCGSRVVPCGQTDGRMGRHDEATSRFSRTCLQTWRSENKGPRSLTLTAGGAWRVLSDGKEYEILLQDHGLREISLRIHKVYNV